MSELQKLEKAPQRLEKSTRRSENEHRLFVGSVRRLRKKRDVAVKRSRNEPVAVPSIPDENVNPSDLPSAGTESEVLYLKTAVSATQLGINLAIENFTEDELINFIVSPQKTSRDPLDKNKILEIKKQVNFHFPGCWPEARCAINQKCRDLKRARLRSVKEPAAQPIAESDDSSRNLDNIDDFLGAK